MCTLVCLIYFRVFFFGFSFTGVARQWFRFYYQAQIASDSLFGAGVVRRRSSRVVRPVIYLDSGSFVIHREFGKKEEAIRFMCHTSLGDLEILKFREWISIDRFQEFQELLIDFKNILHEFPEQLIVFKNEF